MTDSTAPVSVIIPCFLCQDTIERAVFSVLRQTMLPREILLVDDASPDGGATVHELKRLAKEHGNVVSIRVVLSLENGGPGSARNQGWELASQPYIALLDSDDAWLPEKIEIQYKWMNAYPNYSLTCHQHLLLSRYDADFQERNVTQNYIQYHSISGKSLLYTNPIATRTVMFRRDLPYRFLEGKRYTEDYLLWLSMVFSGVRAAKIEVPLAIAFKADFGSGGLSENLWRMELGELNTYITIYQANLISFFSLVTCIFFSLLKFVRRIILSSKSSKVLLSTSNKPGIR